MAELKNIRTKLDYYNGENEIPEGQFRISASSIYDFFTSTNAWFRENLYGETGFISSTASVLGTCVHFVAETYAKTEDFTDADKLEVENYIIKHTTPGYKDYNPDIDGELIREQYKIMAGAVVNEYIIPNMPTTVEDFLHHEILDGIRVGGSCDAYQADEANTTGVVVDYKTTGELSAPKKISMKYRH